MASILKVDQINDRTNNNKAIEVDSSGRVSMPKRPYATVGFIDNLAYVAKTAGAVVDFDRILEQEGSDYSTTTYKYTCPVDGLYMMSISVLTQNDNDKYQVNFYRDNDLMFSPYAVFRTMQASAIVPADAGDTLYFTSATAANYYEAVSYTHLTLPTKA